MKWWDLRLTDRPRRTRPVPLVALALMLAIGALGTVLATPDSTAAAEPVAGEQGQTSRPSARPPRPVINPVGESDDVVVPDENATSGLPASGVGAVKPTDALRDWTMVAVALLALNAVVLAGLAARSLYRQRLS